MNMMDQYTTAAVSAGFPSAKQPANSSDTIQVNNLYYFDNNNNKRFYSSQTLYEINKTLNMMISSNRVKNIPETLIGTPRDNALSYDNMLLNIKNIRLNYDDEGYLILPSSFPQTYLDGNYKGQSYRKSSDSPIQKQFLAKCYYLLMKPLESVRLLEEVASEALSNIQQHFRFISKACNKLQQTETEEGNSRPSNNVSLPSVYNLEYKSKYFSKTTLQHRHLHFCLMVYQSLFQYTIGTTKTKKGSVNLRSLIFLLQSKINSGLTLLSTAKHNKQLTTIISTLTDISSNHRPYNYNPSQLGSSYLYIIFSSHSRDVYIGETTDPILRVETHLSQYIKNSQNQHLYKEWRKIKKLSIAFFPIQDSIRKLQEKDLIQYFKPNLNKKDVNQSSTFLSQRLTTNEFKSLYRSLPIRHRSTTRGQKFLISDSRKITEQRNISDFPSKLRFPKQENKEFLIAKNNNLINKYNIKITPTKQLYRAARTVFHRIDSSSSSTLTKTFKTYHCLRDVFEDLKSNQQMITPQDILVTHGNIEISKKEREELDSLISCKNIIGYAKNPVSKHVCPYRISNIDKLVRCLNSKLINHFSFEKFYFRTEYSHLSLEAKIRKIGQHRTTAKQICRHMNPRQIRTMYYRAQFVLSNTTERGQARKTISTIFEQKFKIPIGTSLHFCIPAFYKVKKRKILRYLHEYIEKYSNLPFPTIEYLKEIVCVSFTKQDTILQTLANNISFGKEWKHDSTYSCDCSAISEKYGIPLSSHGCIQINATDIPTTSAVYSIFSTNARNKMLPSLREFHESWKTNISNMETKIKILTTSLNNIELPLRKMTKQNKHMLQSIYDDIVNDLETAHEEMLSFSILKKNKVLEFKRSVQDSLVISELGKAKGVLHLCCAKKHSTYTRAAFYDNSTYFQKVPENTTEESILNKMRKSYTNNKWNKVAPIYKEKAIVSYLYLQPKAKNFEKFRPLASYFHHLLKGVYRRASMGLTVILKNLTTAQHFNLFSTYQTKDHLEKIFDKIELYNKLYEQPYVKVFSGDVQQLFTELKHSTIISALKWALMKIKSTKAGRGRSFVTLNLKDKTAHRLGPSYDDNGSLQISFKDIFDISVFDMENVYFRISNTFLLQVFGIPQGSPLSPALASCVLIWVENQFIESIRDDTRFSKHIFMGIRYVDDIRIIVLCASNSKKDIELAHLLIQMYIDSFPESLLIEPEPSNFNICRFLEAQTYFSRLDIKCAFVAKNYTFGHNKQYQYKAGYPFQVYQKSYSDEPKKEVRNCINTRLHAVLAYSMTPTAIQIAMESCIPDFIVSNFPKNITIRKVTDFFETKVPLNLKGEWEQIKYDYINTSFEKI